MWYIEFRRMFKKIAIIFSWFLITPVVLISLYILINQHKEIDYLSKVGPAIASESDIVDNELAGSVLGVQISDMRPYYVENFLKNTRLEPYSHYIVEISDKYDLDYRLIPAIAMKESGGGNAVSEASHNAWGFENGRTQWDSWGIAIDKVGKTLKEKYVDRGMETPDEMMAVYAPPQIHTGGKWAKDINHFFEKLTTL